MSNSLPHSVIRGYEVYVLDFMSVLDLLQK